MFPPTEGHRTSKKLHVIIVFPPFVTFAFCRTPHRLPRFLFASVVSPPTYIRYSFQKRLKEKAKRRLAVSLTKITGKFSPNYGGKSWENTLGRLESQACFKGGCRCFTISKAAFCEYKKTRERLKMTNDKRQVYRPDT